MREQEIKAAKQKSKADNFVELPEHLPYQLLRVSSLISLGVSRLFQTHYGLSTSDWRIIAVLGYFGSQSSGDLAHKTVMDKATTSRTLKRLERKGYIQRKTASKDRRRRIITLTEAGDELHNQVAPMARMRGRIIAAVLSKEERTSLVNILAKLETQIEWLNREEESDMRHSTGINTQ